MIVIETDKVTPNELKAKEREWVYNGLDCCITAEVLDVLLPQLDSTTGATYAFSRELQGPVLEMRLRGILIDRERRAQVVDQFFDELEALQEGLERIVGEGCGFYGFNWRSPKDLQHLFYSILDIPVIRRQGRPTVNREALEKLELYPIAEPLVMMIKRMNELGKKISMLKTEIDHDGRIRTSYNIAGTTTGRFSSSFSEFGTGGNLQNVEESLRSIFVADPGMKMAYIDAQQGESRVVGAIEWNLFGDGRYLDACESGDLHTTVAKLVWPGLQWKNDPRLDKALAEEPYYRHYSRRFMCKKIGHGTNYGGKPATLAAQAKVNVELVEEFQPAYFASFPAHLEWHEYVTEQVRRYGQITHLTGRRRDFWGRRDAADTIRAAIASDPQGSLADIVNAGMLAVWRSRDCQLLLQGHDAIVIQYPEQLEDEVIPKVLQQLRYPLELIKARTFLMPYDVKTGWNWGNWSKDNPDGLKEYRPGNERRREKKVSILDRKFR